MLSYLKSAPWNLSLTLTKNFSIASAFSKGPGYAFSKGPGLLYKYTMLKWIAACGAGFKTGYCQ